MNTKILESIGLTDGEIRTYLALIHLGPSTTGPIVDKSKVSSSKIYNVLERLMEKGLVSYIIKDKTRHYQAEDPAKIQQYLDNKEEEFKKQRTEIDEIISQLQIQKRTGKNITEAQIYKGFRGIQTVNEHIYQRLKKGDGLFFFGVPSYQDEKYLAYWQKDHGRREKSGFISRALFNQKTDECILKNRNIYKTSDARYMPINVDTPAWIMGYADVTVIGLPSEEELAIEIVSKQIADSFKAYFEAFWKLSKPFK